MYKLIILIEAQDDPFVFDDSWPQFLRVAETMPGLIRETHARIERQLFGNLGVSILHELYFETRADLQHAMTSPQGQTAGQVLQQITQGKLSLLVAEHREDEIANLRQHQPKKVMLTPDDLQSFMAQNNIPGEIVFLDVPTPTVEAAAQAVGTEPERIVKSVLFTVDDQKVLTIACGTQLIERRAIAGFYEVGRKRVRLASQETVLKTTGYPVGTVPPFSHANPSQTLLDPQVLTFDEVYAGGGAHNALVRLNPQDILTITQAQVIDLHRNPNHD